MQVLVIALLSILVPHVCLAQPVNKVPVVVSHQGTNQVGRSVASALEDAIRSSSRFTLVAQNNLINLDTVEGAD
jgi:hypothetical protein